VDRSGEWERIDPWTESMERKNIQKPFLCRCAMGYDPAIAQRFSDLWPEVG
jgi:hypothetical protein